MTHLSEADWNTIIKNIQDEKAVLFLGPEIKMQGGQSLHELLRAYLHEHLKSNILFYYERDRFFLFQSPSPSKGTITKLVGQEVRQFYENVAFDEVLLMRVVQIPFDLILSVNPDTALSDAFHRYGVKHYFRYFDHSGGNPDSHPIEKFAKSKPLIYNLFGKIGQDESLILQYDDFYNLVKAMLTSDRLPNKLRAKINHANTYVFLGFQFDRWYSQLLFKLLDNNSGASKIIAPHAPLSDTELHQFVIHQFGIQFIGETFDFLGALYQRCADRQLLRTLQADSSALSLRIEKHVENGELDEALTLLATAAQHSEWEKDVILLQGRYAHLENSKPQTDSRDYRTEKAQILNSILQYNQAIQP